MLANGDTSELTAAREEFRKLIRSVVATPQEERGQLDVTVETEMAALVSQGGHIKALGAGTRTIHCDMISVPLRVEA